MIGIWQGDFVVVLEDAECVGHALERSWVVVRGQGKIENKIIPRVEK